MIEYTLIRSGRKTIAIQVTKDAQVIVRAPNRCSVKRIEEFVLQNKAWIEKHLEKAKSQGTPRTQLSQKDIENLRNKAKEVIPQKVKFYSDIMKLYPTDIKITSAKKRYGSCNSKNSLCFSLYLMLESDDFINYVVVHELAHIKYKNHSKEFHSFAESFVKNPKKQKNTAIS